MNYGWVRRASALAMVAVLAGPLAACDRGTAAPDETAAQNLRAAEFFLTSNARVEGVKTLPSGVVKHHMDVVHQIWSLFIAHHGLPAHPPTRCSPAHYKT